MKKTVVIDQPPQPKLLNFDKFNSLLCDISSILDAAIPLVTVTDKGVQTLYGTISYQDCKEIAKRIMLHLERYEVRPSVIKFRSMLPIAEAQAILRYTKRLLK